MQKDWLIATNYMKTFITLSLKLIITSIIKTVIYKKKYVAGDKDILE